MHSIGLVWPNFVRIELGLLEIYLQVFSIIETQKYMDTLIQEKNRQFEQLNQQFLAYEEETRAIIDQLEHDNAQLKVKCQHLQNQLEGIKEKRKEQVIGLERQNQFLKREVISWRQKAQKMQKDVVELENNNQGLENQLRAVNALLEEYQSKVEHTMEELACLRIELDQSKENNQEQMARLQAQIRETEEELNVVKMKHQKHHDQSQLRMSQFSWTSGTGDKKWRNHANQLTAESNFFSKRKQNMLKENSVGFEHTMQLMNSLLIDLDKKCLKLRYNTSQKQIF